MSDFLNKVWDIFLSSVIPVLVLLCFAFLVFISGSGAKKKEAVAEEQPHFAKAVAYVKTPDNSVKVIELSNYFVSDGVVTLFSKNGNKYETSIVNAIIMHEKEESKNGQD